MQRLRIHWVNTKANFGDSVTPELLAFLLGCEIRWATKWRTQALTIGSLLGWALVKELPMGFRGRLTGLRMQLRSLLSGPIPVFGTGFLYDPRQENRRLVLRRRPLLFAVRGAKTLSILKALGGVAEGQVVPLGDPGLLFPDLWADVSRDETSTVRAYLPHESEWDGESLAEFRVAHPEIRLIDVRRPPREVFAAIAACGEVFSSSLHGLIAADALGVPNRWVRLSIKDRSEAQNRFKFDDYYSAYGESREPCMCTEIPTVSVGPQIPGPAIAAVQSHLRTALEALRRHLQTSVA